MGVTHYKYQMKNILFVLLLATTLVRGQGFEGVINWKMTMEITDPKVKAQMEEAQKKMNDPAQQAQMKEMEERMNDPEMKAMMEANPQMKAQLEKAMKMAQGGGDMSSIMPTGYSIKIKNQNSLISMQGGMMANTDILFLSEKNTTYKIDRESKTYSTLPQSKSEDQATKMETKVTKTSETAKILGYSCIKYIVDITTEGGHAMQQFFWTTTAIKDIDFKSMANDRMSNSKQRMYFDKVDGVPLKVEMSMPQGNMIMEVTELKKMSLPTSDFAIPAGFKEVPNTF